MKVVLNNTQRLPRKTSFYKVLLAMTVCFSFVACSSQAPKAPQKIYIQAQENAVPGTVTDVWQEPVRNTVRVPGQIDPSGVYYRAPHQTVVEIYPGRVQEVQFPADKRSSGKTYPRRR